MPTINFNQARNFLNNITQKNKVAIIHDNDADGFTAAILLFNFLKNKKIESKTFSFNRSNPKNYNLKKFDTILIVDLAPSIISKTIQTIQHKKVFYTDHHPATQTTTQQITTNKKQTDQRIANSDQLAKRANHHPATQTTTQQITTNKKQTDQRIANSDQLAKSADHHPKDTQIPKSILEYRTKSEISSAKTIYNLTGGNKIFETIANLVDAGWTQKENKKIINKFLKKNKITFGQFNRKVMFKITRTIDYLHNKPKKAFKILKSINSLKDFEKLNKYDHKIGKEIKKIIQQYKTKKQKIGKINFFHFKAKYPIKSAIINEISYTSPKQTYIFATPTANNKKIISLSARNQTKKIDMAELLNSGIKNLKNASAGGHVPAAGATIQAKDLNQFKQNLKQFKYYKELRKSCK